MIVTLARTRNTWAWRLAVLRQGNKGRARGAAPRSGRGGAGHGHGVVVGASGGGRRRRAGYGERYTRTQQRLVWLFDGGRASYLAAGGRAEGRAWEGTGTARDAPKAGGGHGAGLPAGPQLSAGPAACCRPRPVSIALCRRPCTTAGPGDPWWSRGCVAVQ